MRKEVTVAIGVGFTLGLLITGGVWWFSRNPMPSSSSSSAPTTVPSPSPTPIETAEVVNIPLTIDSPAERAIIADGQVEVAGVTAPGAVVVLIYPEGETIVEADEEGNFAAEVELQGGANDIVITAYDYQGNKKETTLTVVYSTAKI